MKKSKLLLVLLILPWLTVPFLGVNAFKKYLPSALFICTFTKALDMFGEKKKWWRIYKGIGPLDSMNFFNWGPYFVSALWMLKMSYGKFPLYLLINAINHIIFTFFGLKQLKRYKIALVNIKKFPYLMLLTLRELVLYGFQLISDLKKSNYKV
ncbi:hypothetical protein [Bacillus sp. EB600]|uniref:hypothetical protein n=1 Tax=Bacillus sp. EB600 TaxID=2806345 RepID=UPI0021098DAA|nr:hypothetical protein [Bacillus sp. EB600]MCQ6281707.1 hypothetical protein [Bacillus sp. EB600]